MDKAHVAESGREPEFEPELEPTGLVDPREIHPGLDPSTVPEGPPPYGETKPAVSGSPAVEPDAGVGVVDPRPGLPGPDFGP